MSKTTRRTGPQTVRPCVICETPIHRTSKTAPIKSCCSEKCRLANKRRSRSDWRPTSHKCAGCGVSMTRNPDTGGVQKYCSVDCRPRCKIEACSEPRRGRGWCAYHHQRWRATGDPECPSLRALAEIRRTTLCVIRDCGSFQFARGWCPKHHASWKLHGDPLAAKTLGPRLDACILCGSPTAKDLRRYCSQACWAAAARARSKGIPLPGETRPCLVCGADLGVRRINGKATKRIDTLACRRCRVENQRHGVTPADLAAERGTQCRVCRLDVDMTLRAPDLMRASVDHRFPRARGGTHERSNLQLVHLRCNYRKNARILD